MDMSPDWNKVKKSVKRISLWALAIVIIGGIGFYIFAGMTYSEGTRSGVLTKISKKGYIFKTYEGDLALSGVGGYIINPREEGNVWSFSVKDDEVYEKMKQFEGRAVSLDYEETYRTFIWWGETRYFITDVNLLDNQNLPQNTPQRQ